jgi:hypothetical protein
MVEKNLIIEFSANLLPGTGCDSDLRESFLLPLCLKFGKPPG